MALKPCISCGQLAKATRCAACAAVKERARPPRPTNIDREQPGERKRRAFIVASWRMAYGDWCPGFGRPAHDARPDDLTADHLTPVSQGGTELSVLCRSCNGRKAAR